MAVPRKKVSRSRRNMRRAHDALPQAAPMECPNCGELRLAHHICKSCGQYGDREMVEPAERV